MFDSVVMVTHAQFHGNTCSVVMATHAQLTALSALLAGFLKHSSLVNEEEAFRYAIDVINENKTVLPQTKLVGEILDFGSPESSPSNIIRAGRLTGSWHS